MHELTLAQRQWLTAPERTSSEQKRFLTRAQPEYRQALDRETRSTVYLPALRSVVVRRNSSEHSYATSKEALEESRAIREQWLEEIKGDPALDEKALGIDGNVGWQMHEAEDATMRIESVVHIGNLLATDMDTDAGRELIDDLCYPNRNVHPSMKPLLPPHAENLDGLDDEEAKEIVVEHLMDNGCLGIAIQAATPVKTAQDGGRAYSYSWGHYQTQCWSLP